MTDRALHIKTKLQMLATMIFTEAKEVSSIGDTGDEHWFKGLMISCLS